MIFNPLMLWLLRSPLHPLVSGSIMAITYTGRMSGKTYIVPVNYQRVGEQLITVSDTKRTWWRNMRGGAQVTLRLRGKDVAAYAQVFEDFAYVAQGLKEIVRANPSAARFMRVRLDEHKQPSLIDLDIAARDRVLVRVKLLT